jgi:hypothetical protein
VATTKAIRQALVDTLKPAPDLTDIKTWHRVSGFVPDRHNPTGAVGSGTTTYDQQDNDWDLATTQLPIYIATADPNPERAEDAVQELGEAARTILVADNPTLGGVVRFTNVTSMPFTTAEADGGLLVHFVTLQVECVHMVPRFRTATEPPADVLTVEVEP